MIVTTTPSVEGYRITGYYGIVFGEVITGINFLRDFGAGIRNIVGGRSEGYEQELLQARNEALQELEQRAASMGAHAVVGVDMDYEVLGQGNMLMVTASGTAVTLEQASGADAMGAARRNAGHAGGARDAKRAPRRAPSAFKREAYFALEDVRRGNAVARIVGIALFALIVANAILVFAETQPGIPAGVSAALLAFGLASSVCFARMRYALSPMGIIDLLAFAPGLLVLFVPVSSSMLNAARIIRLVRLIKLSRYMRGLRSIARVFRKRRPEIVAAFMVLALLTVTASVLMYEIEHPVQPEKFDSVFTGMYWAMTTITTTGYGDLVPVTAAGRLVGFCTMLLSIGVVAIPAGIFSAGFVSEFRAQDARDRLDADALQGGFDERAAEGGPAEGGEADRDA